MQHVNEVWASDCTSGCNSAPVHLNEYVYSLITLSLLTDALRISVCFDSVITYLQTHVCKFRSVSVLQCLSCPLKCECYTQEPSWRRHLCLQTQLLMLEWRHHILIIVSHPLCSVVRRKANVFGISNVYAVADPELPPPPWIRHCVYEQSTSVLYATHRRRKLLKSGRARGYFLPPFPLPFSFLPFLSLSFPPSISQPPVRIRLPSLPLLEVAPIVSRGSGEVLKLPSGSGQSPAAKLTWCIFGIHLHHFDCFDK